MPRGEDYSPKLKAALDATLPALEGQVQPKDITVTETPEGNYLVKVAVFVALPGQPGQFTSSVVVETYSPEAVIETEGRIHRARTTRLALAIRKRRKEVTAT
jgi:hypothetical protein